MKMITSLKAETVHHKRCFIRTDYNCPLHNGGLTDTTRIDHSLAGLKTLREQGAKLVLASHLGRPKGQLVPELSLAPVARYISERLGVEVVMRGHDETGEDADIILLENLRFDPGEEKNDSEFAQKLARHADIYINDAFSCAHRAHASTHAITQFLPSYAGPLLMREVDALKSTTDNPRRPVGAIVGGAKVSTKLEVLTHLVRKVDHLFLGGGMANTFIAAQGAHIGASLYEPDMLDNALRVMTSAQAAGCVVHLPVDGRVATRFEANASSTIKAVSDKLAENEMILDIGPASLTAFTSVLDTIHTVLWNGPMGAFELDGFDAGTVELARYVAEKTQLGQIHSVAGGGDTVAALNRADCLERFGYVSLAGGAFLEWIEGKQLPGLAALDG